MLAYSVTSLFSNAACNVFMQSSNKGCPVLTWGHAAAMVINGSRGHARLQVKGKVVVVSDKARTYMVVAMLFIFPFMCLSLCEM